MHPKSAILCLYCCDVQFASVVNMLDHPITNFEWTTGACYFALCHVCKKEIMDWLLMPWPWPQAMHASLHQLMHGLPCYAVSATLQQRGQESLTDKATRHYVIMCYAMLCYAMLCYAMLCYAMLCYVCYALLCYAMLCYAMLCYAMLCYAMLCIAMLCYAMLCCAAGGTHCWRK